MPVYKLDVPCRFLRLNQVNLFDTSPISYDDCQAKTSVNVNLLELLTQDVQPYKLAKLAAHLNWIGLLKGFFFFFKYYRKETHATPFYSRP